MALQDSLVFHQPFMLDILARLREPSNLDIINTSKKTFYWSCVLNFIMRSNPIIKKWRTNYLLTCKHGTTKQTIILLWSGTPVLNLYQHSFASSFVKCALIDRNGGIFKETPDGSLLKILKPFSVIIKSPARSWFNTPQWSTIAEPNVELGHNSSEKTPSAPFGARATHVTPFAFTMCLLLYIVILWNVNF